MAEKTIRTQALGLDRTTARCAVIVHEKHPRSGVPHIAVGLVNRPYWSKQGANEWSLVGGKVNDQDIEGVEISDTQRSVTMGESQEITRRTAQRELKEELNVEVELEDLIYVGLFNNGEWVSALFYILLEERPSITIAHQEDPMDEIDGFVWMGMNRAAVGDGFFADHKLMIDEAVSDALGARSAIGSK